jgi:twitching motility protein PilT
MGSMQYDKLFQLLGRDDVKEVALQADRPPCVLVGTQYTAVLNHSLGEDEVLRALVEANGRAEVALLVKGPRRWRYDHPTLGPLRVSAGYHSSVLQARLKREAAPAAATKAEATQRLVSFEQVDTSSTDKLPDVEIDLARADGKAVIADDKAQKSAVKAAVVESERWENLGNTAEEIFESLLRLSRSRQATDLHILADRSPMLRIGGDMVKVAAPLGAELVEKMLMAQVPERLREELSQHGSCDFALTHFSLGRFRTNVSRQRTGMKLTARPIRDQVATLAELGLPESIAKATHHHQGLILVTGPTGHGKTTTLSAIVDVINSERTDHIITVEDPVECVHERKRAVISQREVGTHTRSFAAALKASLREDPDVIAVGELRDTETVRMALSASETGHLVISTMNTPSAAKTIERMIDLFPPADQPQVRMSLAGGLRMVISQRLVPSGDRKTVRAAVELLPGSPALWALIRDNKTFQIPSLQQRGKALGIVRLDDSLAELVRTNHTTLEIAKEFAEAPEQLEGLVRGTPVRAPEAPPPANDAAQAAQKFGKDMFAKAGKLFGGEK